MTWANILAGVFFLLVISPVIWEGWKMYVNHLYYAEYHRKQDDIQQDASAVRWLERLTKLGGPNPPY